MKQRPPYRPLSRRAAVLAAGTAVAACCAYLAAVLGPFASAGTTPWVPQEHAALVEPCSGTQAATPRHACLRQAAGQASSATRVAMRTK